MGKIIVTVNPPIRQPVEIEALGGLSTSKLLQSLKKILITNSKDIFYSLYAYKIYYIMS